MPCGPHRTPAARGLTAGCSCSVRARAQVYIGGEFIGGCDTTIEMYKSGELKGMLQEVGAK